MNEAWTTQAAPPTAPAKAPPGRDVPGPTLPLGYADPTINRDDRRRERAAWVDWLGGPQQIGFALGLALVAGGVSYCTWPRAGEGVFWIVVGALLIGLTARWPVRK